MAQLSKLIAQLSRRIAVSRRLQSIVLCFQYRSNGWQPAFQHIVSASRVRWQGEHMQPNKLSTSCLDALENNKLTSIYADLQMLACWRLRREPLAYLWSEAALINEAYIRIAQTYGKDWIAISDLKALWAVTMKHVLFDHGRSFRSRKRSAGNHDCEIPEEFASTGINMELRIGITAAFQRLRDRNPRRASAAHKRYVQGFTIDETAQVLNMCSRTAKRELRAAKIEIQQELG